MGICNINGDILSVILELERIGKKGKFSIQERSGKFGPVQISHPFEFDEIL